MTLTNKALIWAAAIILAAFAGAVHWISAEASLILIGTLPALAVIHLGAAATCEPRCSAEEL